MGIRSGVSTYYPLARRSTTPDRTHGETRLEPPPDEAGVQEGASICKGIGDQSGQPAWKKDREICLDERAEKLEIAAEEKLFGGGFGPISPFRY